MGFEKWNDKKPDKRVKYLYENIHKTFLERYEAETVFSDIFSNGNYNCVSATALYCMAFDYFHIPYSIKEKPNHVYPVAFPANQQVIVETTNPQVGSFAFNTQFKQSYIENLRKSKLVSQHEIASTEVNQLFDKYFFKSDVDINLLQLVGIQYMNEGIYRLDADEVLPSVRQFEKAYLFYPSEQVANGLLVSYLKAFQGRGKKDSLHASLLAKLSRFEKYGISGDNVKAEFSLVTNHLLFELGKSAEYATYFAVLDKGLRSPQLKEEIGYLYNYEHGRYYYNQGRYSESEPYFEKAMSLRPNSQEVQTVYLGLLERNLRGAHNGGEAVEMLKTVLQKNPALATNNNFNSVMALNYLRKFSEDFENAKPIPGDEARLQFEKMYTANKDLDVNTSAIGQAYSTAAVYYFKKNLTAKAKYYINRGLEIDPENYELKRRKLIMQ
jgi:tetratricopeptide (TPR) repeat protein